MFNNKKIGVGIVTYNRKDSFKSLYDSIKDIEYVDYICVVKGGLIDYGEYTPKNIINQKTECLYIENNGYVGACKNAALLFEMNNHCDYLFLIEDDIKIKDPNVFKEYITTAEKFKLEHLNFGRAYIPEHREYRNPFYSIGFDQTANTRSVDFFHDIFGGFSFFTRNVIEKIGYLDDQFINAVEHIDHTYRIIKAGYTSPFWAFADIENSDKYLEDAALESSIVCQPECKKRIIDGWEKFRKKYGFGIMDIPQASTDEIIRFMYRNVKSKSGPQA